MLILLSKTPHTAIGSRIPGERLLGLRSVGGPVLDAEAEDRTTTAEIPLQSTMVHPLDALAF
jgi:hypothetical protein